ncbi:protein-disulfide reductase DsbD domain-containing protein [uncultured Jannaschia sp.]|uniref:protein-disulfide reductase DsbD family protein n=1 Tax=uncultured Jannaschia sp. TaxID=293347 RepID=UPI0026048D01|nr:protein-disulfide reductase DsbD domain-containing protein [uncultured Jannaschia sp.]
MISLTRIALSFVLCLSTFGSPAVAAVSEVFESPALTARLVTVEDGTGPDAGSISAGLALDIAEGWKTYWRSPGEVGLPPEVDWQGSKNVAAAEFQWPAPMRFRAFGIENFGYADKVVHPIRVTLAEPGEPARLRAAVSMLACSDICVPLQFDLALDVPAGTGIDQASAARVAEWAARVPASPEASDMTLRAAALPPVGGALTVALDRTSGWRAPDVFPEMGQGTAFGGPDIRVSADGRTLWASLPVLALSDPAAPLTLTVTDGPDATTFENVTVAASPPPPPYAVEGAARPWSALAWILALAFGGGLILNAMPCVLPVLSVKLSSALNAAQVSRRRVRTGFLATAAGTLAFMLALAGAVIGLQALGYAIGWGTQFQNPYFLVLLVLVLGLFAASFFGLFDIALPSGLATRLAAGGGRGHAGDFATGAFAAVLATPCSAPLLGTAVAFALTGSSFEVVAIFTAMGLGLALPYLIVAARPDLVAALPRPGRWMLVVKAVLGLMLAGTAAWLLWVLAGVQSEALAWTVAAVLTGVIAAMGLMRARLARRGWATAAALGLAAAMVTLPAVMRPEARAAAQDEVIAWVPFARADIARHVSEGHAVFVDVTADWCLTCIANKSLVLERAPVVDALAAPSVVAMQADWTRPDPRIAAFLEANGRFGIPFNIVYGPAAPEGIALSEVLTPGAVIEALTTASGTRVAGGPGAAD